MNDTGHAASPANPAAGISSLVVDAPIEFGLPSDESAQRTLQAVQGEVRFRRCLGIVEASLGVLIVVAVIAINAGRALVLRPTPQLITEAVVSLVAMYFGYALLRAAERMFLPSRFLHGGEISPEAVKAFLGGGVRAPSEAAIRQVRVVAEVVRDLAQGTKKSNDHER